MRADDVTQTLLERAVAAMSIRVKALHESLVLSLDVQGICRLVEAKGIEGPLYDASL